MNESDEVSKWINRITSAEKVRNDERDRQGWLRFIDEYQGQYGNEGYPPINLVYGYVHTEIPKLYFRDPYIAVNPKGRDYILQAKLLEAAVNYLMGELQVKKEVNKALMDALLCGHGWIKYGYTGTFGTNPDAEAPQPLSIEQVMGDQPQPPIQVNEFVKNEEIFVVHVPWDDILFNNDMSKDPPYDCRWIAHRVIRPLQEVKDDPQFINTATLQANVGVKELTQNKSQSEKLPQMPDMPLVEYWEITDKETNQIICVAKGHDKFLCLKPNVLQMEGLNYSMLKFNDVPGKPYPLSDIHTIEAQILSRIRLRAIQLNHIKRWNRQVMVEKGAIDGDNADKLEQGTDGALIEYTKGYLPPKPMEYGAMQSEIFTLDNLIQRDMDSTVGQLETERGGEAKTETNTLGELQNQLQSVATRSQKRQDVVEDFLDEIGRKVIQLLKQFQTTEKYIRLTGDPQQLINEFGLMPNFDGTGLTFTREDIQGEYDIETRAGSMVPVNKQARADMLIKMVELGPALGIIPGGPVSVAIGREFFRDFGLKSIEAAYDEEQMMKQQMMQAAPPLGADPNAQQEPGAPPPQGGDMGEGASEGFAA